MQIKQLYIHPIKSLRPIALSSATLTPTGILHDRRYMLFKCHSTTTDPSTAIENWLERMTVTYFPSMGLFTTELFPGKEDERFFVTYHPPIKAPLPADINNGEGKAEEEKEDKEKRIEMLFEPEIQGLEELEVDLHGSPVKARNMGKKINEWFSSCFGWDVVCVYMPEGNTRAVLGNLAPRNANAGDVSLAKGEEKKSWFSAITAYVPEYRNIMGREGNGVKDKGITFADCAPYLFITEESLKDVSRRMPDGISVDVTKFRPNIVLEGAEEAFEEDFWGGLSIVPDNCSANQKEEIEVILTQNCIRCQSLDIDYQTGTYGKGAEKTVLKKLMRDRRLDAGKKHSPVFGRYGFLADGKGGGDGRFMVRVGDEVRVTKKNQERTTFYWPGLM